MIRERGPSIQKIDSWIVRDSISFWTDLSWSASEIFYLNYFARYELLSLIRVFERVRSGSYFFNRSPRKFSLLNRRSLFSDRVTYTENTTLLLPAHFDINIVSKKLIRIRLRKKKNIGGIWNSQVFHVTRMSIDIILK